eukprot:SAG31_NODE_13919_length_837_cov_1.659892_1_plen_113_part_10
MPGRNNGDCRNRCATATIAAKARGPVAESVLSLATCSWLLNRNRERTEQHEQEQRDVFVQEQEQRSAVAPQLTEPLQAVNDMLQFIFATQCGRAALLERIAPWRLEQMRKQLP